MNKCKDIKNLLDLENKIYKKLRTNKNLYSAVNILSRYNGEDWKEYVKLSDNTYVKNLVCKNIFFEIFILSWNSNQKSPIHNHAKNGCLMKILYGKLEQELYSKNVKLIEKQIVDTSNISYIDNNIGLHSINNNNNKPAVSLHIYSPPNYKTQVYVE